MVNRIWKLRRWFRRLRMNLLNRPEQSLLTLTLLALVNGTILYILYQVFRWPSIDHDHYDSQIVLANVKKCHPMNSLSQKVFAIFIQRIINTFEMLDVTYFLCYETLWTTLKRANEKKKKIQLKMTDACFNLCVLNEDLIKHDETIIMRRFMNNGITVKYIHSDGIYILKLTTQLIDSIFLGSNDEKINDDDLDPILFSIHARVHVFEKDSQQDMFRRIGWRSRLLPSTMCKQLHCFPTNLVQSKQSLPKLEYLPSLKINVPREGVEIQKYHYPDSWWMMADSNDDECT